MTDDERGVNPNPAYELALLFESWFVPANMSPFEVRGANDTDPLTFWRSQVHAVELVKQCERGLGALGALGADTEHFHPSIAAWYAGVFSQDLAWVEAKNDGGRRAIAATEINAMRMLGSTLEELGLTERLDESQLTSLVAALDAAEDLIKNDTTLERNVKRYLLALVREAWFTASEAQQFTPLEVKENVFVLTGAMEARISIIDNAEQATTWRERVKALVAFAFSHGSSAAISSVVTKAIEAS